MIDLSMTRRSSKGHILVVDDQRDRRATTAMFLNIKKALEVSPQLQVIRMTAYGSIESAVEAMRQGAFDCFTKPFKTGELSDRVTRAWELPR